MNQVYHQFAVRLNDLASFPREFSETIAIHGLLLKTQKPIQLGETISLQFRFPQREEPLTASGIVVWVSDQVDTHGKRSIIVKKITLDKDAQALLTQLSQTAELQAVPHVGVTTSMSSPMAEPSPIPIADAKMPARETTTVDFATPPTKKQRRRWLVMALIFVCLLVSGLWLFVFGGLAFIQIRWGTPPPTYNIAYSNSHALGVEPPIPYTVVVTPPPQPPITAIGFDYFQRPTINEFIITFNRPIAKVVTSRLSTPLLHVFYIENARVNLEREQYFLPFDLVRTVTFEVEEGSLRISFVSQNPHYLPEPTYDIRGRELIIKFIATD